MDFDEDLETEGFESNDDDDFDDDDDDDEDDEAGEAVPAVLEEEEDAPLVELLDRPEPVAADEFEEDDVVTFEAEERKERLTSAVKPLGADEFVCQSCFLVLKRSQLADARKNYCVDCV